MLNKSSNDKNINRHFIPANREWSNSVYYFNKNNLKEIYSKDYISNNIIKSYFKLTPKPLRKTKSKRMRDLIRRSTTRQLFVSRSYIKQTSHKSLITVYLYDREQKRFNKRLFRLNSLLTKAVNKFNIDLNYVNKVNSYTNGIRNLLTSSVTDTNSIKSRKSSRLIKLTNANKFMKLVELKRASKATNKMSKYNINYKSYNNKLASIISYKTNTIKTIFYYYFFKWILSLTKLNVNILYKGDYIRHNNYNIAITNKSFILYKECNADNVMYTKDKINKIIIINNNYLKLFRLYNKLNVKNVYLINNIMYKYICLYISNVYRTDKSAFIKNKLFMLYMLYYNKFYKRYRYKFIIKQYYVIYNMYKSHVNNIKLKQLLPGLKLLLNNVYNKDIEFNLVKLKYLHLNSDIFVESISVKLRKKTSKLLRILKKSLKLVKIPKKILIDNIDTISKTVTIQSINTINKFKGFNVSEYTDNTKDKISGVLSDMYTNKHFSNNSYLMDGQVYDNVKYKWVTGIRLEAKGRLTRRYTASRSLFKFKYKGNIRNLDFMNVPVASVKNEKDMLQTPSLKMVRNQIKPNIQYTLNSSKKRIGAFGIKGWISNN